MSTENMNLGEAELEIMMVLWKQKEAVNSKLIGEAVRHKNWKRTTIATLLARLVDKGALSAEKHGAYFYYTPQISAKQYRKAQTLKLIKSLYDGSVKELAVSLFEDEDLSSQDINELKAIFDDKEV